MEFRLVVFRSLFARFVAPSQGRPQMGFRLVGAKAAACLVVGRELFFEHFGGDAREPVVADGRCLFPPAAALSEPTGMRRALMAIAAW